MIKETVGNIELLRLPKTAFLCNRRVSASAVLRCYDWALEQRQNGACVISGFHSQIEKDVLHYLLKGTQPIIVALARYQEETTAKRPKGVEFVQRMSEISEECPKLSRKENKGKGENALPLTSGLVVP